MGQRFREREKWESVGAGQTGDGIRGGAGKKGLK